MANNLYIVSDRTTYSVAEELDPHRAVEKVYSSRNFRFIPRHELDDDTVTHAMCCEYTIKNMNVFNSCTDESAIVLLMDELDETCHFQLTDDFYA